MTTEMEGLKEKSAADIVEKETALTALIGELTKLKKDSAAQLQEKEAGIKKLVDDINSLRDESDILKQRNREQEDKLADMTATLELTKVTDFFPMAIGCCKSCSLAANTKIPAS